MKPAPRATTRRTALLGLGAAALVLRAAPAAAQGRFPERPIALLVPFAPGGIADLTARAVAEQMGRRLGQPVVVENRPSAGSIVASQAVASARPDGYTLLLMSNGNAVSASLFKKLPYDTLRAFAPITTLASFDLGLFVAAGSPLRSLAELLAQARAQPGRLKVGSITPGSTQHLSTKLFETVAGVELLVVPYKGTPAVLTALRAGEIDLAFEVTGPLLPQLRAGALRVLAVTGAQRNPALPEVPTVQQAGLAGYEVASWNALAAPAGTPAEVLQRLARAAHEALATPELQTRLAPLGLRLQAGNPAELQALLVAEVQRWGGVIRAANIQPE